MVVAGGEAVAIWRLQARGRKLALDVELFARGGAAGREVIEAAAQELARFRGCTASEIRFSTLADS